MQIDFYGGNCVRVKTKKTSIVFDDNLKLLGLKSIATNDDVVASTNVKLAPLPEKCKISFSLPGDYEVGDIMLSGVAARAHIDEDGTKNATIFRGMAEDMRFVVAGHIHPELTDAQLEEIGMVDILFIPVGGAGYTLDGIAAAKVVKSLQPKLVIPTHFDQKGVTYEVPQNTTEEFIKSLGIEPRDSQGSSLKIKKADLTESTQVLVLE